MVQSSMNVCAW